MIDTEIQTLCNDIAAYLPGWVITPSPNNCEDHVYITEDMRISPKKTFTVTRDWRKKDRVNVQSWAWPKYTNYAQGREQVCSVTPSSLYSPNETSPSISCAISKGAEGIAKDIARRFIPEFSRVWLRCYEKAMAIQKSEDAARDSWHTICTALGKDPAHIRHYIDNAGGHIVIENRSGKAHLEFYADAGQVTQVINVMNGGNNETKGDSII